MKIKITEKGFENFTGQMGVVFFENGFSTADVSSHDAFRMSAVMGFEWEDGTPCNVAQRILDNMNAPAPNVTETFVEEVKPEVVVQGELWTEDELGKIADEEGIAGLRAIADPLGIKDKSVAGLISGLLKAGARKG